MAMLNRTAIILIPKQPYADWANSLDDDGPRFEISEADDELTVFLGPDQDTVEEIDAFVSKHFDFFFEDWLSGWSTDPAQWPQRRTRACFASGSTSGSTRWLKMSSRHLMRLTEGLYAPVFRPRDSSLSAPTRQHGLGTRTRCRANSPRHLVCGVEGWRARASRTQRSHSHLHHGAARDLYGLYTRVHPQELVARAVGLGILSEDEVPPHLREALTDGIQYYRSEPHVLFDDDDSESRD